MQQQDPSCCCSIHPCLWHSEMHMCVCFVCEVARGEKAGTTQLHWLYIFSPLQPSSPWRCVAGSSSSIVPRGRRGTDDQNMCNGKQEEPCSQVQIEHAAAAAAAEAVVVVLVVYVCDSIFPVGWLAWKKNFSSKSEEGEESNKAQQQGYGKKKKRQHKNQREREMLVGPTTVLDHWTVLLQETDGRTDGAWGLMVGGYGTVESIISSCRRHLQFAAGVCLCLCVSGCGSKGLAELSRWWKSEEGLEQKPVRVGWWVHIRGRSLHLPETFAAIEKATISYPEEHSQGLRHWASNPNHPHHEWQTQADGSPPPAAFVPLAAVAAVAAVAVAAPSSNCPSSHSSPLAAPLLFSLLLLLLQQRQQPGGGCCCCYLLRYATAPLQIVDRRLPLPCPIPHSPHWHPACPLHSQLCSRGCRNPCASAAPAKKKMLMARAPIGWCSALAAARRLATPPAPECCCYCSSAPAASIQSGSDVGDCGYGWNRRSLLLPILACFSLAAPWVSVRTAYAYSSHSLYRSSFLCHPPPPPPTPQQLPNLPPPPLS